MSAQHAQFPPSKMAQYLACPASYFLSQSPVLGEETESYEAKKGTAQHEIMAEILQEFVNTQDLLTNKTDWLRRKAEIAANKADYPLLIQAMEQLISLFNDSSWTMYEPHVETQVYPFKDSIQTPCYGTADFFYQTPNSIILIDFKFGATPVNVKLNPQLMLYAKGVQNYYGINKPVVMYIIQPAVYQQAQRQAYSYDGLNDWTASVESFISNNLVNSNLQNATYCPSQQACKWCRAKAICKKYAEVADEQAATLFEAHEAIIDASQPLDEDQLFYWYEQAEALEDMIKTVKQQVRQLLVKGPSHGYKLVRTRGVRTWKASETFEQDLGKLIIDNPDVDFFEAKLKTPPALLSEYPQLKKNTFLQNLIVKGEGKSLSIVPESDSRPAYVENPFESVMTQEKE